MRALTKEKLIKLIENKFEDNEVIMEEEFKGIWVKYGDEYYINRDRQAWELTKKNTNW